MVGRVVDLAIVADHQTLGTGVRYPRCAHDIFSVMAAWPLRQAALTILEDSAIVAVRIALTALDALQHWPKIDITAPGDAAVQIAH